MASNDIKPFKVDIPQEEVDRLKRKLKDTRIPPKPIVPGKNQWVEGSFRFETPRGNCLTQVLTCFLASFWQMPEKATARPMNGYANRRLSAAYADPHTKHFLGQEHV